MGGLGPMLGQANHFTRCAVGCMSTRTRHVLAHVRPRCLADRPASQWTHARLAQLPLGPTSLTSMLPRYAPQPKLPYAIKRYQDEGARLFGVLEAQLADGREWLVRRPLRACLPQGSGGRRS